MSNEIKKPTNDASAETVTRYLMKRFPEWKNQLKEVMQAYDMPFKHFCEKEAEYRLENSGISSDVYDYASMAESIANELFESEVFTSGDVADQITSSVLNKDFCIDLKDEKQVLFLKENYFESELLLTLSGAKLDLPLLASLVCEMNIRRPNQNMKNAFQKVLKEREMDCDYITTKELQELFLTFQKNYEESQTRIKIHGGELIAEPNLDPGYPGISVYLKMNSGDIVDLVLLENKTQDDKSVIDIYNYSDVWSEDWTSKSTIHLSEVNEALEL